jgi:hypothetical protein
LVATLALVTGCAALTNYTTTTVRCSDGRTLSAAATKKFVLTSELSTIGVLLQQNGKGVANADVRLTAPAGRFVGVESREFVFTTGPDGRVEALWRAPALPGLVREDPDGPWKYRIEVSGFEKGNDECTGYLTIEVGR